MNRPPSSPARPPSAARLAPLLLSPLLLACASNRAAGGGAAPAALIQVTGSDTMLQLAQAWAEAYRTVAPRQAVAVTGGGSGAGIAALINDTTDIANASRHIKDEELAKLSTPPEEYVVAVDALAVVVHPDNPVDRISLPQLSAVYQGRIRNWRELGGRDAPIVLLSRETNSGTHVYFLEEVLRLGDKENRAVFASRTLLMPSSVGITSEIRRNPNAIGYDGLGYVTEHEKVLALAEEEGDPFIPPSVATARDGSYPLSRALFIYTRGRERPELKAFIDWVLGDEGQALVERLGFVPRPR